MEQPRALTPTTNPPPPAESHCARRLVRWSEGASGLRSGSAEPYHRRIYLSWFLRSQGSFPVKTASQ